MGNTEARLLTEEDKLHDGDEFTHLNCELTEIDGKWSCSEIPGLEFDRLIADMKVNVTHRSKSVPYENRSIDKQDMILHHGDGIRCRYEEGDRGSVLRCVEDLPVE